MADQAPDLVAPRVGVVLAGGGARGAYEVGVLRYILEELPKELGREIPIDIFCGTSAGAINACHLAAFADQPRDRARLLAERWLSLRVEDILRPAPLEVVALVSELMGREPKPILGRAPRGGLIDPVGLRKVLTEAIPFDRIDDNIDKGRLLALSVSATHVGSGRTVVFVQHHGGQVPRWGSHPSMDRQKARLRLDHALASAAIPFLFPAVTIDGHLYCDGGLRQNVPLSPARRLGAERLIVVNPHFLSSTGEKAEMEVSRERVFAGPVFLLGKTLNALLLDRLDGDVDRLNRINDILAAGVREYGPGFVDAINRQLGLLDGPRGLRPLETIVVRATRNIGELCYEFTRSAAFLRDVKGLAATALRRLAGGDEAREADLLSYILFDGEFAGELIALGEADARARREELLALFEPVVRRGDQRPS